MKAYTIGALAKASGVATSTVRYYERAGLLRPDARSAGNYRVYTPAALQRLRFIRSAQSTGLSLGDISELLSLTDSPDSPCNEVDAVLRKRLSEVEQKMKDLRQVRRTLSAALVNCCNGKVQGICEAVIGLKKISARRP